MRNEKFLEILRNLQQEINTLADHIKNVESVSRMDADSVLEKLRRTYDEILKFDFSDQEIKEPESQQITEPKKDKQNESLQPEETLIPADIDEDIHKSESETAEIDTDELMLDIGKKQEPEKPPVKDLTVDLFSGQNLPDVKKGPEKKENEKEPNEIKETENPAPKQKNTDEKPKEPETRKEPLKEDQEETKKEQNPEKEQEAVTIAEKIQQSQQEETVADKIKKNKISSLKVAIGINEKFFFINELFNGSLKDYNSVIEDLDQKQDLSEANAHLTSLQQQNMWDPESDAYAQLKQFLERKFV